MRNKIIIAFCIIVFVGLGIFAVSNGRFALPKSWDVNLLQDNKDPYGLYIIHEEIGHLSKGKVQDLDKLSELEIDKNKAKNYAVAILGTEVYLDSVTKTRLNKLVENGGIVFVADYEDNTDDTIYTSTINVEKNFDLNTTEKFSITNKKPYEHCFFDKFAQQNHTVLGNLFVNNQSYPNLVKFQPEKAKGFYLYHAEPLYFTNYYLLNQDSYFYAKSVLQNLKGRTIFWYNPDKSYATSDDTSMMRYIMSQPALKYAWITLLILLFLYLIFKSKREQRIIPIYEKEENHTVEFAKTISSLYQENGEVKDIINKKIDYFLYKLRKNFLIETDDLTNAQFIEIVSQKANIPQEDCVKQFEFLKIIQQKIQPSVYDLKKVHEIIENYKQKANI